MESWPAADVPRLADLGLGIGQPPLVHDTASDSLVRVGDDRDDVRIYVCGITPYDATHLGHAATYLLFDTLQRVCLARRLPCLEFAPVFPPGDDRSFNAAGIPNVSVAFLPAAEAHQLWLLLNGGKDSGLKEGFMPGIFNNIHSPGDLLAKVEPATLDLAAGTLLDLVLELDATLDGGTPAKENRE